MLHVVDFSDLSDRAAFQNWRRTLGLGNLKESGNRLGVATVAFLVDTEDLDSVVRVRNTTVVSLGALRSLIYLSVN